MNLTEKQILTTIIGILAAPWLARVGVLPTSPAYPVLIGAAVGVVPLAYHAIGSVIQQRFDKSLPPPSLTPEQLGQLIEQMQKLGVVPPPTLPTQPPAGGQAK